MLLSEVLQVREAPPLRGGPVTVRLLLFFFLFRPPLRPLPLFLALLLPRLAALSVLRLPRRQCRRAVPVLSPLRRPGPRRRPRA